MNIRDHEDIHRTCESAFLRGTFAKDKRNVTTLCVGKQYSFP
jgi:hypothetical protein